MPRTVVSGTTFIIRLFAVLATLTLSASATVLLLQFGSTDGFRFVDVLLGVFIFLTTSWLSWGALLGVVGVLAGPPKTAAAHDGQTALRGRTAIIFPVYNEEPMVAFARVAAMDAALAASGHGAHFDIAILSDTTRADVAAQEEVWYFRLLRTRNAEGRIFYRRRAQNTGRKAGNIKDFVERAGAAYDHMLILDADSLMEADTIVEMVRRMESDQSLGLLQSLPKIVNAKTIFGRAMQFSASFYSPHFARGQERMQGVAGPFWGHNALVRVSAFAAACGLPELPGKAPFGGHILSHDYVEAALLAGAGWTVRLDTDLEGSYEEGPEDVIAYAKRDRRWCQGNLQHWALLRTPGFLVWSRFVLAQGIMSYVAPLLWLLFIGGSIYAASSAPLPDYFPEPFQLFPVFPGDETAKAIALFIGIIGLLVVPKALIVVSAGVSGRSGQFGGALRAGISTLFELVLSSLLAPVLLAFQTRSVLQVLSGVDGGWPATSREAAELSLEESNAASYWIALCGLCMLLASIYLAPALTVWLLPIGLPMLCSPIIIWATSKRYEGPLFRAPSEHDVPPIVAAHYEITRRWRELDARTRPQDASIRATGDALKEAHGVTRPQLG